MKALAAWALLAYFLVLFLLILFSSSKPLSGKQGNAELPDFTHFSDAKEKKTAFFTFLVPVIDDENSKIRQERKQFREIHRAFLTTNTLSPRYQRTLSRLLEKYKVRGSTPLANQLSALERRINTVPAALVLSQAANESAWGSSRFAQEGNNLFGQWCFSQGCGIVPANRNPGATHEVQRFESVNAAVAAYLNNINTHQAYAGLRKLRHKHAMEEQTASAHLLAGELGRYSERGDDYIREIRQMIAINNLE